MSAARETVLADILDLTHDARGVADVDGRRVFVAGALPHERVEIEARVRRRKKAREAALVDVVAPAAERVEAPCPYFGRCGGCAVQHMSYAAQLRFKQNVVAEAFSRLAGLEPDAWLEPVTGPQWHYRRRARLGVKYVDGKERVLVGFRERGAPYITDMTHCPILVRPMDRAPGVLAEAVAATSIKRRLPQAEVAAGDDTGAIVLRVLDTPSEADAHVLAEAGRHLGVDIWLQPGGPGTAAPLEGEPRPLVYRLAEHGVELAFNPTDFVQVNADVNARMVSAVLDTAAVSAGDRVLDLYCGIGNLSLPLARRAARVVGFEGDAGLVARAARNAERNGIANAEFVGADLTEPEFAAFREPWDVVVLDPPRTGAEPVVGQMRRIGPSRVVYVSCHPATLARDARILVETQGYRLRSVGILDMFPQTYHVEAMACFER